MEKMTNENNEDFDLKNEMNDEMNGDSKAEMSSDEGATSSTKKSEGNFLNFIKSNQTYVAVGIVVLAIVIALFLMRGMFIAATVNGSVITRSTVKEELEKQGGRQILDTLINEKLIEAELDKNNVEVSEEEVDAEIEKVRAQVAEQGGSLDAVLSEQGLKIDDIREQILIQKRLEKLLSDKTTVTDEEIDTYIETAGSNLPQVENNEQFREEVRDILVQQKFQQEAQAWVAEVTATADIKYFGTYAR